MFEDMGLQYSGPIDGHDVAALVEAFQWAKGINEPALVHVITQKGKGYEHSERSPDKFHGVTPFNLRTGRIVSVDQTFSSVFGEHLEKLAVQDPRICAITAAMTDGTGLANFATRFPHRFFDVGIAEGHAVTMAAGMASKGAVPVFAVYSTFLQRAYDMLLHDVAIEGLHVVIAVDRAGLVPGDGETHQGVFDVAFLSTIPGMTVMCPSNFAELRDMLLYAVDVADGPVAMRYPRGCEGAYKDGGADSVKIVREGTDFTLATYGISVNTAVEAAEALAGEGISVEIVKLGCINPLDIDAIAESTAKTGRLMVLEECAGRGCVGEGMVAALARSGASPGTVLLLNTGDVFAPCGEIDELRELCHLDAGSVCEAIRGEMAKSMMGSLVAAPQTIGPQLKQKHEQASA
jgi:1-deoxy-D-xylulose-5-phosphate synthase